MGVFYGDIAVSIIDSYNDMVNHPHYDEIRALIDAENFVHNLHGSDDCERVRALFGATTTTATSFSTGEGARLYRIWHEVCEMNNQQVPQDEQNLIEQIQQIWDQQHQIEHHQNPQNPQHPQNQQNNPPFFHLIN